ncbi:alpha/beta hydrolase [Ralstonia insidiosa]|uniref:alpha/beta hydrolase n=1 Tax=Ralstonia TaxID=48736 RepID=UPI00066E75DA|nr:MULTISPECIES: alpha/beta hydrolase [Ralstonia]MBY4708073.1 alpha/beta hydrolase [Ralstonia insidiosa]GAQ26556.1 esterase [Ralstonia sp. NT80]
MTVDAETQAFMAKLAAAATKPRHLMTPVEAREAFSRLTTILAKGPEVREARDLSIPVTGGVLAGRLYLPHETPSALLVYFHGGGWVVGSVSEFDPLCRELAVGASMAVALVEYRKAPEHPFPGPVQDAWDALQWLAAQREALLGAELPLLVGGDSAGANLAIATTLRARDASGPALAGQLLVYPVTDCRFDRASYVDRENQLLTNLDTMRWYWSQYAPDEASRQSSLASPCREPDLSGLPEAIVVTAEHDVLRDEGEEYAARLQQAGVPVHHLRAQGQMHGFLMMLGILPGSQSALRFVCERLRAIASAAHA